MIFNPDVTKQPQEMIFSIKTKKLLKPCLSYNDIPLNNSISQKRLGLTLDVGRKDQLIQTFLYGNPNCNLIVNPAAFAARFFKGI